MDLTKQQIDEAWEEFDSSRSHTDSFMNRDDIDKSRMNEPLYALVDEMVGKMSEGRLSDSECDHWLKVAKEIGYPIHLYFDDTTDQKGD